MPVDVLPTKPVLPPDFIDCSVGEPFIIRDNLIKYFDLAKIEMSVDTNDFVYPDPAGHAPLVKLLEDKHEAPVIITNGAKQGLAAAFYALKQLGQDTVGTRLPYWALLPPLAKMQGISLVSTEPNTSQLRKLYKYHDCLSSGAHDSYLMVAPNNPDGHCLSDKELIEQADKYKQYEALFIHDAAYYNHIYLPEEHSLPLVGDMQIFSMSKAIGLSGLRCGYVTCPNRKVYDLVKFYIDHDTVGVSLAAQSVLYNILYSMEKATLTKKFFTDKCRTQLKDNKALLLNVSKDVLEIPDDIENLNGLFGFFKVGPKADFKKSKLNFVPGDPFGMPGYIRMNLAYHKDKMEEIINRLNSVL